MTALVLIKEHSQRVPGKSHRRLCGKPLFCYLLETIESSQRIDRVVVNVDSPGLKKTIEKYFNKDGYKKPLDIIIRPEEMRKEFDAQGNYIFMDILAWTAEQTRDDVFIHLHVTSPFLTSKTIDNAIWSYRQRVGTENDSLLGVTSKHCRLMDRHGNGLNFQKDKFQRLQDIEPVYEENSSFYIFPRRMILEDRQRVGDRPYLFRVPPIEAHDIDTEQDWTIAEAMMRGGIADYATGSDVL